MDYCRRYFTESWKKITGLCHTFRRHHRRIGKLFHGNTDGIFPSVSHRELEKNYGLVPQFPTASPTEITDGTHRWKSHIPKCTPVRSIITDGIAGDTICDDNFRRNYRRIKKKAVFLKFLVRISIYFHRNYRRKLMPPTTINVPSVMPTEILAYKTLPPPPISFFLLALISISFPLHLSLIFGRVLIVLVVVFNILKGM